MTHQQASKDIQLRIMDSNELITHVASLSDLLHACVHDGASIGYILPFETQESEKFWRTKVLPDLMAGTRFLLAAFSETTIIGTVQLGIDTMPNQAHRADVSKLLVHPGHRRQGVAQKLMQALEELALKIGRTLLVLDTRTGDSAEPLYTKLGFTVVGCIPDFCRDAASERLDSTTIMYKHL